MAFTTKIVLDNGLQHNSAYCRAGKMHCSKEKIYFTLEFSADCEKEAFYGIPMDAPYELEGVNPFKQAYSYARSLPEYADAIDC